jgi:hypothetical protein
MMIYFSHLAFMLNLYIARTLFIAALYLGNYTSRIKAVFD